MLASFGHSERVLRIMLSPGMFCWESLFSQCSKHSYLIWWIFGFSLQRTFFQKCSSLYIPELFCLGNVFYQNRVILSICLRPSASCFRPKKFLLPLSFDFFILPLIQDSNSKWMCPLACPLDSNSKWMCPQCVLKTYSSLFLGKHLAKLRLMGYFWREIRVFNYKYRR